MRSRLSAIILLLLLVPAMALAVSDMEELRAYLWNLTPSRPSSFTIEGSRSFSLSAHLEEIGQMLYDSGLTGFEWFMQNKRLQIQNCSYASSFALCSDEDDVLNYMRQCREDALSEGQVCLTPDMYAQLSENSFAGTYRLLALAGLSCDSLSYNSSGTIGFRNLTRLSAPVYQIEVDNDLALALSALKPGNACTLVLAPDVYSRISDHGFQLLGEYTARAGITGFSYLYNDVSCILTLTDLLWADTEGYSAETEDGLLQTLGQLKIGQVRDFRLLLSPELYARFLNHDPALFRAMLSAGFQVRQYSYSDSGYTLHFHDVDWNITGCMVHTLEDAVAALQRVPETEGILALICDPDLFASLTQERIYHSGTVSSLLRSLMVSAGLYGGISMDDELQVVYFPSNERYVGVAIASMVAAGREMELSGTQQSVLNRARELLSAVHPEAYARSSSSQARTVCGILDQLSRTISYEAVSGTTDHDNAAGALLRGRADCDGYADTFYLLCSLSGIPVMLQHGDSMQSSQNSQEVTHVWTLICVDGAWYMCDPTFCDTGNSTDFTFAFLGEDLGRKLYDTFLIPVSLNPVSDLSLLPYPAYTVSTAEEAVSCVQEGLDSAGQCAVYFTGGAPEDLLIRTLNEGLRGVWPSSYVHRPEIHQYIFFR